MAVLIIISFYFFELQTTVHSWLGIIIVLTTTYCYMNIAMRLQSESAAPLAKRMPENAHLLEDGETTSNSGDPYISAPSKA